MSGIVRQKTQYVEEDDSMRLDILYRPMRTPEARDSLFNFFRVLAGDNGGSYEQRFRTLLKQVNKSTFDTSFEIVDEDTRDPEEYRISTNLFRNVRNNGSQLFSKIVYREYVGRTGENIVYENGELIFVKDLYTWEPVNVMEDRSKFVRDFAEAAEAVIKSSSMTSLLRLGREEFVANRFRPSRMQDLSEEDAEKFYIGNGEEEPQFGTLRGVYGGKTKKSHKKSKKRSKARKQ